MSRFVIQEHYARRHHYDLRLEKDGVLKSWAIPKNLPLSGKKRLAIQVEDHPLDYIGFEGIIPQGEYGAGTVTIWDQGEYEPVEWGKDKILFVLHGNRLRGKYALIHLKKTSSNHWLFMKID